MALLSHHEADQIPVTFTLDPANSFDPLYMDGNRRTNLPEGRMSSQSRGVLIDSMFKGTSSKGNFVKDRQGHTPLVKSKMFKSSETDSESSEEDAEMKGRRESKQLSPVCVAKKIRLGRHKGLGNKEDVEITGFSLLLEHAIEVMERQGRRESRQLSPVCVAKKIRLDRHKSLGNKKDVEVTRFGLLSDSFSEVETPPVSQLTVVGEWGAVGGTYGKYDYSGGGGNDGNDNDDTLDEEYNDGYSSDSGGGDSDDNGDRDDDNDYDDGEGNWEVEEEKDPLYWNYFYKDEDKSLGGKEGWYCQEYNGENDEEYVKRHIHYLKCEKYHSYKYDDESYVCYVAKEDTEPGDTKFYIANHVKNVEAGGHAPYWRSEDSGLEGEPPWLTQLDMNMEKDISPVLAPKKEAPKEEPIDNSSPLKLTTPGAARGTPPASKSSKSKRKSNGDESKATNGAPLKKVKTENEVKSVKDESKSSAPTRGAATPPTSSKSGAAAKDASPPADGSTPPSGPVTEDEIKAVLSQTPLTSQELAAKFRSRLKSTKVREAFSATLRRISKRQKTADGATIFVLK